MVVDGGDNGMAHILQRLIHVDYQRISFTTVGNEIIPAKLGRVVIGDLLLDARAFNARVGRKQLVLAGGIGEVIADFSVALPTGIAISFPEWMTVCKQWMKPCKYLPNMSGWA